jgi:hypothetical protein
MKKIQFSDAQRKAALCRAACRAAWPFLAGAAGGLFAGCTIGGVGPNFL